MSADADCGHVYVISAPSGAGKTSLVRGLCRSTDGLYFSVSHTTRPPRPGEQDGRDYHFVDIDAFRGMISREDLLEHAEVFGNFYGTSARQAEEQRQNGLDVILELDWQGAQQVAARVPDATSVFILPPSRAELQRRLEERGTDAPDVVARRMAKAVSEISHYHEFSYVIVNHDFDTALAELQAVICSRRLRQSVQRVRLAGLVRDLLT